jgi:hypothetical protein
VEKTKKKKERLWWYLCGEEHENEREKRFLEAFR